MADFESIVRNHVGEDGNIPSEAIAKLVKAISTAVGNEFVEKSRYKAKLEEIDALTEEKQTAQDSATTAEKWKTKYQALKDDFDTYKTEQTKKESHAAKEKAYRALLQEAGVSEKRLESVLKVSDIDSVELDENGAIKGADKLTESIKSEWADFITTTQTRGAQTSNPPANNNGGAMTKADIYKKDDHGRYVLSAAERQQALIENHQTTT